MRFRKRSLDEQLVEQMARTGIPIEIKYDTYELKWRADFIDANKEVVELSRGRCLKKAIAVLSMAPDKAEDEATT